MADYTQLVKDSKGTVYNIPANVAYSKPDQLAADLGITPDKIDWGKIRLDANYKMPAITSAQLAPQPKIDPPTQTPSTGSANSAVTGSQTAGKSYQDYINSFTPPQTQEQQQASQLSQDLMALIGQTSGQRQAVAEEENRLGLPQMNQEVAGLNADLLRQVQEYNVAKTQYDNLISAADDKVQSLGKIRGEQGRLARAQATELNLKASEAKLTEARIAGKLGQVEQAQNAAKRAVDLRYAPVLEAIEIKGKQLAALQASGILTQQQEIQAKALEAKYNADLQAAEEEKAKAKSNLDLALSLGINTQYTNKNGEFFSTRTGQSFSNKQDFFKDAGVTSFEEAYSKGLITNLDNATIQQKAQVGKLMADYFDAGITMADDLDTARRKVEQNSRKYRKETNITGTSSGVTGFGTGTGGAAISNMDSRVKEIIKNNPGEWGKAADQIDAAFGKGTATLYDSWLKSAYADGKSVDQLGQSPVNMNAITQTILASGKLTNQQRADVINYVNQAGLPGAQAWWVNNKFGAGERENYNLYESSSQILAGVLPTLEATNAGSVGPYKALWESKKPYLLMQQDQQYAQLYQMIETAQAQIRKGFYGTAVTGTESSNAARFLINPEDSYTTVTAKVKGLMGVLSFVNDANTLRPFGIKVNFEDYVPMDIPSNSITNQSGSTEYKGFFGSVGNWLYGDN